MCVENIALKSPFIVTSSLCGVFCGRPEMVSLEQRLTLEMRWVDGFILLNISPNGWSYIATTSRDRKVTFYTQMPYKKSGRRYRT